MTTDRLAPAFVTLYEPAGSLAAALTGGPRTAVLLRLTETADGTPYYQPAMRGTLKEVADVVAQLTAPDTEPAPALEPIPLDDPKPEPEPAQVEAPHSRACGFAQHAHGVACSDNCPTCHGKVGLRDAGHDL